MADKKPDIPQISFSPTPENTPVPGGGSWTWDATRLDWVPSAPYAPPVLSEQPITQLLEQ